MNENQRADDRVTTDIMQHRCIIAAARIEVAGAELINPIEQLKDQEWTPYTLRQAEYQMNQLADIIDEGKLERAALDHILQQQAEADQPRTDATQAARQSVIAR